MRRILAYQVDAFTRQRFEGNAAGVVPDADGLSDEQMQQIAAELNNSETAFVLPPDASDHDLRIRFFTPTTEVPTCGHATIAAHYVRARERRLPKCKITHRIGIGILPVEIHPENGEYKIVMHQAVPTFEDLHEDHRAEVLEALGISSDDLDRRCPVEIASTGHSKVMVGLNSREMLNRIVPNLGRLRSLSEKIGCNGYFVFTRDSNDSRILTHARMFAPAIGIGEDPVTGNGNGPLGAYLVRHGLNGGDSSLFHFHSRQGEAMGRPGEAEIWVDSSDGEPTGVRVGGYAVIAFRAQFEI